MNTEIVDKNIKKWKLNELEECVDNFENNMSKSINSKKVEAKQDYNSIVLFIAGRAMVSFKAVITLAKGGFDNDALSISRKLFEDYIVLLFFKQKEKDDIFNEYVSDFWLDFECQKYTFLKYGFDNGFYDEIDEKQLCNRKESLKKKSYSGNISPYGWSRKSGFWGIVKETLKVIKDYKDRELLKELCIYYKRANMEIHTSAVSALSNVVHSNDKIIFETDQKEESQGVPLYFATRLFFEIVNFFMNHYNTSDNGEFGKLMDLIFYYQQEAYLKVD